MQTNEINEDDSVNPRDSKDRDSKIKNPFAGYTLGLKRTQKVSPVHEIVDIYFRITGKDKMPADFYRGRYEYRKMASEAKKLLQACNGDLDDCIWALDKMKYLATKGRFDWSISTCLKHELK